MPFAVGPDEVLSIYSRLKIDVALFATIHYRAVGGAVPISVFFFSFFNTERMNVRDAVRPEGAPFTGQVYGAFMYKEQASVNFSRLQDHGLLFHIFVVQVVYVFHLI
jgi:hypothetical protein